MHTTYFGDIERGKGNASLTSLVKIADALQVEIYDLFRFSTGKVEDKQVMDRFKVLLKDKSKVAAINEVGLIIKDIFG